GQLFDRRDHLRGGQLVEHVRLWPRAFVLQLVVEDELADVVEADVVLSRPLEAVPEEVAHDREQPGLHVRALLVAVLVAQCAQIRLLDQVLRRIRVARQSERAPVQRVEMCKGLFREGSLWGTFRHQYCQFRYTCPCTIWKRETVLRIPTTWGGNLSSRAGRSR